MDTKLAGAIATHIELSADTPVVSSRQEGGRTVMAGTFTPLGPRVVIDVDISAMFFGWGAGGFDFHVGVIETATDPWEPGGKNRIVKLNFESRTPLAGVKEGTYRHFMIGMVDANRSCPQIARKIVLDDLDAGTTYQWELRCGGASFFKQHQFSAGARPTSVAVTPDGLYAWVGLSGANRLALVQLGWAELWDRFAYSPDMISVAEIPLRGAPGGIAPQPIGPYLVTVDRSNGELVLVDTEALSVDGSYALPGSVPAWAQRVVWNRLGTKVYVGGNDGRLHRFDLDARSFDQSIVVDASPGTSIVPLDLEGPTDAGAAEARYGWCSALQTGRIVRVDFEEASASTFYSYDSGLPAPTCGVARQTTDGIVVVDQHDHHVRYLDATGRVAAEWNATLAGEEVQTDEGALRWSSVCLDADEVRAFWTDDGVVGWAWIDGSHEGVDPATDWETRIINKTTFDNLDWSGPFGDIVLTANEGTLLAIPDQDRLIQWPGGNVYLRPSEMTPGSWGTEHALVSFTGAEATGG